MLAFVFVLLYDLTMHLQQVYTQIHKSTTATIIIAISTGF